MMIMGFARPWEWYSACTWVASWVDCRLIDRKRVDRTWVDADRGLFGIGRKLGVCGRTYCGGKFFGD